MTPDVSVIIVSYNTRDLLLQCLRSLQSARETVSLEIIVIDNASSDGSAEVCRTIPGVRVIANSENVGFGRANNQGIRESQSELVLLLNSDTVVLPDTVHKMLHFMRQSKKVGVLGCRIISPDGRRQPSCFRYPNIATIAVERLLLYRFWSTLPQTTLPTSDGLEPTPCDWTIGACMLIRRAALDSVGMFDPDIWLYGEELDLCYKIKKLGWSILVDPAASIVHFGGASWNEAPYSATLLKIAGLLRFCKAHFSPTQYYASYALAAVGAALRALVSATMATLTPHGRKWHVRELRSNILLLSRLSRGTVLRQYHRVSPE